MYYAYRTEDAYMVIREDGIAAYWFCNCASLVEARRVARDLNAALCKKVR